MLSYDEVKNFGKKAGKKQSDREKLLKGSEPAKEAMYKKWQETKVVGGTVNPIISTDSKVKENETLTGRKKTTYEESLARNRKKAEKYSAAVPTGAQAAKNIKELIFGTPKEGGTVNPTISAADFSTRYDKMTAREKAVYSHYKQAGKNKEAADYLKAIEMDVNKRAAAQRTADAKKLAEDSTMGGLYARYMGALTSPLATAYSLVQDARGEAIDPNNPLFLGEQIRQGQTEGFLGNSKGAKKILKEAALGTFDWGSQMATLGALGLGGKALGAGSSAMYGASAFSGNAKDATERGATSEEAVAYGTIGAAAEIITEKLGFERLFKLGKLAKIAGNKGKLAAEILKSMGAEGLEEGTSEAANQIADALIMGDRSQMAEIYMAAKAAGKTEGQAAAGGTEGCGGTDWIQCGGWRTERRHDCGRRSRREQACRKKRTGRRNDRGGAVLGRGRTDLANGTDHTHNGAGNACGGTDYAHNRTDRSCDRADCTHSGRTADSGSARNGTADSGKNCFPGNAGGGKLYKGFAGIQREILRRKGAGGISAEGGRDGQSRPYGGI